VPSEPSAKDSLNDEYLTVVEVAAILKLSPKRVRNMMSGGAFRAGEHFLRPRGIRPRFLRSQIDAWLRGRDGVSTDPIPMARSRDGKLVRRSGEAA
jgi:hypothetical protein